MSTIITKFICSAIMSISGLIIMKRICSSKEKLVTVKNSGLLLCLIIQSAFIYNNEYNYLYTIISYILMAISYKYILNINIQKSIIGCGILIVSIIVLEVCGSFVLVPFFTAKTLRDTWYINILCNVIVSFILIIVFYKTKLGDFIAKILLNIEYKKYTTIALFFILIVFVMSIILYTFSINFKFNKLFTNNFLMFMSFFLLIIILFRERSSYEKLSSDYDTLFSYIKIFEDWIEKEQFMRHEYKNQLAVLRCMTREKKVKEKIDKIISENINIDNEIINELKFLPNGGLKGLIYYKIIMARNNKLDLEVDVSDKVNKLFKNLNQNQIEILSKILGVYLDNAIEAASDSNKKLVLLEIYSDDNKIVFVVSNTFNTSSIIKKRTEKGTSSKGVGRGNGLYFANKLIRKNKWIEEHQSISKTLYIEKLEIKSK